MNPMNTIRSNTRRLALLGAASIALGGLVSVPARATTPPVLHPLARATTPSFLGQAAYLLQYDVPHV